MGCVQAPAEQHAERDQVQPRAVVVPREQQQQQHHGAGAAAARRLRDSYHLDATKLGQGSCGLVLLGKSRSTGAMHAVKRIPARRARHMPHFTQEIAIMRMMDHPNIVKLFDAFEERRDVYLVMELCGGGDLMDRIVESGRLAEAHAVTLMRQIFEAVRYMHDSFVCHRDVKPENFLLTTKGSIENSSLKLIDFGLSCKFEPGQVLSTKAGTPYYVAPQVLAGRYDQQSDLWSVGVCMYLMLVGYHPFYGETDVEVLSRVRRGNFSLGTTPWKGVSEDAKGLVRMLLRMDPQHRCTAKQALDHEWIRNGAPEARAVLV